jgi:tape measure domain-containing protein
MAPGSPELRLNVSFDIDHFKRVALQGLVDATSKTTLDIGVQFNRDDITKEMVSLGRQLGLRKYRVDFEIKNIETALTHVRTLSTALDALNKKTSEVKAPSRPSIAAGPSSSGTIAKSRFDSPVISTGEVAAIYKAAADASLLEFNKAIVGNKREMAAELSAVAKDSIAGLVNALAAGKGEVGNAFANLGAEGLKRIKDRLGIESPSKEMEQIGKWAGKGYELGFVASLEEANLAAAAVIGKSLRKMDGMVAARQRASRQFAPGEDVNQTKIAQLEKQLRSLQKTRDAIINSSNEGGLSPESIDALNEAFKRVNAQIAKTESLINKFQSKAPNIPFERLQQRLGTALGRREQLQTAAQIPQLRAAAGTYTEGSLQNINKLLQSAQLLAAELVPDTEAWGRAQSEIARLNHELRRSGELANKIQMQHDLGAFNPGSLAHLEAKLQLLKNIARDIAPDDSKWKEINQKIQQTERLVEKTTRKPLSARDRMGAAGGAFLYGGGLGGGFGSAALGVAGGLAGGVPGAFAGAAAGQLLDNTLAGTAAMAKQYSELQKMQRGLAVASIDAKDFAEAQGLIASMSQKLLMPLADTTKYYAQLRINTKQYNLSAKDTSKILEGTVNAVRATGGSLEDVDGAMRAVVQIFSKGGVQAEELRGQLGERFPGAVIKFAQANKLTFEELQKRLEAGTVGIAEFVAFSKKNFTDYAEFSKQLATAPEYAGDRLKIALEKLQLVIGGIFAPMGANVQDFTTDAIKDITKFVTENKSWLTQMGKDFAVVFSGILSVVSEAAKLMLKILAPVFSRIADIIRQLKVMTGSANAATAKAEMNISWKALTENKAKKDAYMRGEFKLNGEDTLSGALEYDRASARYQRAEKQFKSAGGNAALAKENTTPTLVFGGAGANMPLTRDPKDEAAKGAEAFAKLQDDLAKTYNDAEIARIKQRYELRKQLQQDEFDIQEYGANRLQKQNLALIKGLIGAEMARAETVRNAQLDVQKQSGKVAGGAGSTGAIFGDTGRTFNAKGFVHGHFQNQDREALVKDTVETVMSLLSKGVSPELGSGARFTSGMNAKQVEALVRQGIGSHKKYAGGASAVDIFVPKGTQVPVPVSGIQNLGGAAGVTGSLARGSQLMHLDKASTMRGAGAITKVTGDQKRDVLAQANTAIAQEVAQQSTLDASITKTSATMREFARYAAEAYNVPELKLSNDLLKLRNDLTEQGMSPETIDYQLRLYEIEQQRQHLLSIFPEYADQMKMKETERKKALEDLTKALSNTTVEEKRKNDETLRGALIAAEREQANRLEMARALTPEAEMRVRIKQANPGQGQGALDSLFNTEQTIVKAEQLKTQMQGVASTIGDAFSTAFQGIINGSVSVQDALGGMFQSIGQSFIKMAMDIIAQQITMITLGFIMKALGLISGIASAGNAAGAAAFSPANAAGLDAIPGQAFNLPQLSGTMINGGEFGAKAFAGPLANAFAKGGAFSSGVRRFATGGIVNGPTLFPFADGGAMQMGLMGEVGPEAIMPLQRGSDGSLGVRAAMGGNGMGGSGSPVLNMSFETSTINGVEYVSRDQLEAAMAQTRHQASRDGANKGMAMTLDKIQQSPQTRRRIGM